VLLADAGVISGDERQNQAGWRIKNGLQTAPFRGDSIPYSEEALEIASGQLEG
jgi:hypothetical protein